MPRADGSHDILAQNSGSRTSAGSNSTTASISGLQNCHDASGTATINIGQAILEGMATTQAALNVAKDGTLAWTVTIDPSSIVDHQSVSALLSGAKFTLKINGVACGIQSTASVGLDGTVYVNWKMDATLKAALDSWLTNSVNTSASTAVATDLAITAMSNDGNYAFSDDFWTKLLNSLKK